MDAPKHTAIEPMMIEVSDYIAGALAKPLPPEVVEKAKHHILDTIAAIAVGAHLKPGQVGLRFIKVEGSAPQCSVGFTSERSSVIHASFAVGMLAGAGET